jgi:hypothetical protein
MNTNKIKKQIYILTLLQCFSFSAFSQSDLDNYSLKQQQITKRGMMALGGWAVGNMVVSGGILLAGNPEGSTNYFHQMNIYWNSVNLGLAGLSLLGSSGISSNGNSLGSVIRNQKKTENLFLLNTGLDAGYIIGGLYLKELSRNRENNKEILEGFGNSVILQGSFLFVFDLTMYFIHSQHFRKIDPLLNSIQIGLNHTTIRWRL